jgi:hypothetical protein
MMKKSSLIIASILIALGVVAAFLIFKDQISEFFPETIARSAHLECLAGSKEQNAGLCAAWAAADAGEQAARWGFYQMILSGFGFFGLLISLNYTRKATSIASLANRDAADSLKIASRDAAAAEQLVAISQSNAERQLRAYLEVEKVEFLPQTDPDYQGKSRIGFRIQITNYGNTPATKVVVNTHVLCDLLSESATNSLRDSSNIEFIAPNDHCGFRIFFWFPNSVANELRNGTGSDLTLKIHIAYSDVFEKDRHIKCLIKSANTQAPSHVEGSRSWS